MFDQENTAIPPQYIWPCAEVRRNEYALFRRSFPLAAVPETADFHLFADSRYRLRVNGAAVGHGPARFAPEAPEYDSFDLTPWLREGENVVTVEVNGYGTRSAERVAGGRSGFIARGSFGGADLATPGDWRVREANDAWDAQAFKFSFIQQAVEVCDTRRLDPAWFLPGAETGDGWKTPVPVPEQDTWGALRPRSVPHYRDTLDRPVSLDLVSRLKDDERRIGCRVFESSLSYKLDSMGKEKQREFPGFAYAFWLHSAKAQTVRIGLFWGDNFLNGRKLEQTDEKERADRQSADLELRGGWNLFYGEMALLQDVWSATIGIPRDAGLEVRAEPDLACEAPLKHTGPIPADELPGRRDAVPADEAALKALDLAWQTVAPDAPSPQPSRMIRWDEVEAVQAENAPPSFPVRFSLDQHRVWGLSMDMGREYHGRLVVEVEAPAGTVLDVLFEEKKLPNGLPGRTGFRFCDPADSYVLRGGRQRIEGFHDRGGRYLHFSLRAPEGLKEGGIRIHDVAIRSAEVALAERGWFRCGDPIYNWAWRASAETLKINQMDVFLPDVWRERGLAVADNRLSTPMNRVLDDDMRVSRRSVDIFRHGLGFFPDGMLNAYMPACPTGPLADFSLVWLIWVEDHWNITGDDALVRDCLPSMERILNGTIWQSAPSGLWQAEPVKPFIDWGATRESQSAEENAAINAYRIAAMNSLARLCERALADQQRAAHWRGEAERLTHAFHDRLWLEDEGRFAVGTKDGTVWRDPSSLHGNVLALYFRIATKEQCPRIFDYLTPFVRDNLERCIGGTGHRRDNFQMLFLHYVLDVLYTSGKTALAEQFLRDHWGNMRSRGAWTTWESLSAKVPSSQCHVWTASPLIHLSRHVLGIRQKHPAREDAFVIEPAAETIDWAEGAYPLSDNREIRVAWRVLAGMLEIEVLAPDSVEIELVPRGRLAEMPRRIFRQPGQYLNPIVDRNS
ncbi:MAG: hypothetical protein ACLFTU_11030 [Puniceicoccaceae bacterium]